MPFDLASYQPVEDRLREFWRDHPSGRIVTELLHHADGHYVVMARVYRGDDLGDVAATGLAEESTSQRGVNATSALENAETSAIGRGLANLGYAAKGSRPSREEMDKASREGRANSPRGQEAAASGDEHASTGAPVAASTSSDGDTLPPTAGEGTAAARGEASAAVPSSRKDTLWATYVVLCADRNEHIVKTFAKANGGAWKPGDFPAKPTAEQLQKAIEFLEKETASV